MEVGNRVQSLRKTRGLTVSALAQQVGVTRQTIYGIEDGSFIPNTAIALRLAQILGSRVGDLFQLTDGANTSPIQVEPSEVDTLVGDFARLCQVNNSQIAFRMPGFNAFLPEADALFADAGTGQAAITAGAEPSRNMLVVAGCDPGLSFLASMLRRSGIDAVLVPRSSQDSISLLHRGHVHVAGSHLYDEGTGDYNVSVVRKTFKRASTHLVTFASWEQGLVVARGNPKGIEAIPDIARRAVRFVNRQEGSGSRSLLDRLLREAGTPAQDIAGYETVASGHLAAAYAVATGAADCCIANAATARCFGLDFRPIQSERFDLIIPSDLEQATIGKALLDALNSAQLKRQLSSLAGYDTAGTGKTVL